jgi:hypothetical protein
MKITKLAGVTFLIILAISVIVASLVYHQVENGNSEEKFFFGVTYGQNTVEEAKLLIDKVKNYTNLFILDSHSITTNNTTPQVLNEICDYAAKADLHFIVYFFSFLSGPWQQEWLDTAKQRWGEKFLGIYLRDEPGGRQLELAEVVENASSYSDAADIFVNTISSTFSVQFLNGKDAPVFTSDFALYWFDYLAGYNTVFAELGSNNSRVQEIALCRGAANILEKDWGAIITWTYDKPPYIANDTEIYQDMVTAYDAGAKYVIVFNYPQYPADNPYGTLTDKHFSAMERFWNYISSYPRDAQRTTGQVAYVLPKDYGWGMRRLDDNIWGIWGPDEKSPIIWENLNKLVTKYGLKLDIIYDDPQYNFERKYNQAYTWNATIN